MIINGTDYTFYLIVLGSFLLLFAVQYLLCRRVRIRLLRHLPWAYVVYLLGLAVATLFGDTGGFVDLRSFFALVILGYAVLCAVAIGLAHLVNRLRNR